MIFRVLKCFCDIRLSHEQAVLKRILQRQPVGFCIKRNPLLVLYPSFLFVSRCLTKFIHKSGLLFHIFALMPEFSRTRAFCLLSCLTFTNTRQQHHLVMELRRIRMNIAFQRERNIAVPDYQRQAFRLPSRLNEPSCKAMPQYMRGYMTNTGKSRCLIADIPQVVYIQRLFTTKDIGVQIPLVPFPSPQMRQNQRNLRNDRHLANTTFRFTAPYIEHLPAFIIIAPSQIFQFAAPQARQQICHQYKPDPLL